jgi:hypothetical protein
MSGQRRAYYDGKLLRMLRQSSGHEKHGARRADWLLIGAQAEVQCRMLALATECVDAVQHRIACQHSFLRRRL